MFFLFSMGWGGRSGGKLGKLKVSSLIKEDYVRLRGNVVFVRQIPKSPAGKILKRLLKDTEGVEVVLYKEKVREERMVAKL